MKYLDIILLVLLILLLGINAYKLFVKVKS